jgi:aquaporin Z
MSKHLTEVIGTFFLVLTIALTASQNAMLGALAIGSILMVMVYMGGHVSGAHYNPAVSLAVFLRGKLGLIDLGLYVVSQLVGALLAAWVGYLCLGKTPAPSPASDFAVGLVVLLELLYTFALALVVLNVATSSKTTGNSFYGLAIGFTVLTGAVAVGPLTGGAFNPAVGTGLILIRAAFGGGSLQPLWIYWLGPLLGGAAAAAVFRLQEGKAPQTMRAARAA